MSSSRGTEFRDHTLTAAVHPIDTFNFLLAPRGLPLTCVEPHREIFRVPIRRNYEMLDFALLAVSFADPCDEFMDRFLALVGDCRPSRVG